jgi:hypothetical protein
MVAGGPIVGSIARLKSRLVPEVLKRTSRTALISPCWSQTRTIIEGLSFVDAAELRKRVHAEYILLRVLPVVLVLVSG